jgi:manganese/iron transport system permease protein
MIDLILPFNYDYMVKAMLICSLIGIVCGLLSSFITLKGWSLMGDALSHSIIPGVSIAYIIGIPFALGAFISGILSTLLIGYLNQTVKIKEDAIIGVVFTSFFAFGLLLISLYPSNFNLKSMIFGNVLGISSFDIYQIIFISIIALLVMILKWKDLLLYLFDENYAKSIGLNLKLLHFTLLSLLAITTVIALQVVGVSLVIAMLVTPGATAYLLTDSFKKIMVISSLFGAVTGFLGVYVSFYFDGSVGGCIVVLQTLLFLVALFFAPKYGVVFSREMHAR